MPATSATEAAHDQRRTDDVRTIERQSRVRLRSRNRAAGARIDSAPIDQPYGQREYAARDPEGHRWWFMSPVSS